MDSSIRRINHHDYLLNHTMWLTVYCLTKALFSPFFKIITVGRHHIPTSGGFILLPKHQCWQDIPLLGLAAGQPLYYIAKYELFRYPIINNWLRSLGGIPLNRKKPLHTRWSFRTAVQLLQHGRGLVLFPEGTYFKSSVGRGRGGMLRFITNRIQIPLIPVGIRYYRKDRKTQVKIRFGAPIKDAVGETMIDRIMTEIAYLSSLPTGGL